MTVLLASLMLFAAVMSAGAADPAPVVVGEKVPYHYSSSGCFWQSSQTAGADSAAASCPLPQVIRWDFAESLRVEFSMSGNCCPSVDRFVVTSWREADTLVVAVADTSPGLCRCSCPYLITVEYPSLKADSYIVRAVPWGDYDLFGPTRVERGQHGESRSLNPYYQQAEIKRPN